MPPKASGSVFDYFVDAAKLRWARWSEKVSEERGAGVLL
jgi:hypothetical protein